MFNRALPFVLIALFAAQATLAQTDPCDKNADGVVDDFELSQCGGAPTDPGDCDKNADGVVDDFELSQCELPTYDEWLASGNAFDFDGSGDITPDDFDGFFGSLPDQTLGQWLAGPDAVDGNNDGVIDAADYEDYYGLPPGDAVTLADWLAGPNAEDLNGDGVVDRADYDEFFGFGTQPDQTLDEWLAGLDAHDANFDGIIDGADYDLVFFGPGISLDDWLAGPDADDVNGDGVVDGADYDILFGFGPDQTPEQWFAGSDAADLNGDGVTDIADYELFFGLPPGKPMTLDEWLAGPEASDLSGDGIIDEIDFELFFGAPPPEPLADWLAGPNAEDLNGDGVVDRADYDEFFGFGTQPDQTLDEWLAGLDAHDVTGDDSIDEADFEAFLWLISDVAEDLDNDGLLDYSDFEIYFFGAADAEFGETPILIDFDPEPGDQVRRAGGNARPGRRYSLQFNINDITQINGWSVTLTFDPTQLAYVPGSFAVTDFLPGGFPLVRQGTGQVGVGTTVLLSDVVNSGSATLGSIELEVLPGFTGSAEVEIVRFGIRPVGDEQLFQSVSFVVTISDEVIGGALPGDFDGDGTVDFPDFFLFAEAFWSDNAVYDLNDDGFVEFKDLFIFADFFGEQVPLFKLLAMMQGYLGLPPAPALMQNYPNPFNSSTTIPFALPANGDVRLEIFDILGQRIRTLVAQEMPAGLHHVSWDGTDASGRHVAGGLFFFRLEATFAGDVPAFSDVRKLMLAE